MSDVLQASSSSSSASGEDPEDLCWDDWTDDTPIIVHSLFDEKTFSSVAAALQYDKEVHKVDLALLFSTLDFFERIRLINWIRSSKPDPRSLGRLDRNSKFLQDDVYLKPVLEDDIMLQTDFDNLSVSSKQENTSCPSSSTLPRSKSQSITKVNGDTDIDRQDLITTLTSQLSDATQALEQMRKVMRDRMGSSMGLDSLNPEEEKKVVVTAQRSSEKGKKRDDDSHYFESYAYNEIHEIMLKDKIRTNAYRDFILTNPQIFKGAVVLDVGCGTGILSMFAAKAGARKVYAVDASAVAFKAERNIKDNGLSEIITVIKGKIEDIEVPEKVDIIISEWMGYFLLYECMLDSVLSARDRFLKPATGLMVPSQCSIMLSLMDGSNLIKDRISFWDDVYGFSMTSMKEEIYEEALIDVVMQGDVVSDEISLIDVETQKVTVAELSFNSTFELTASKATKVHAFLGHFDTFFTQDGRLVSAKNGAKGLKPSGEVFFTTGAAGTPTHWKQTIFLMKKPIEVKKGSVVSGSFSCRKNADNSRELVVEMTWTVKHVDGERKESLEAQVWKVR